MLILPETPRFLIKHTVLGGVVDDGGEEETDCDGELVCADDRTTDPFGLAVQFAWAIILVVGMLILPETPRFLIKQDRYEEATKAWISASSATTAGSFTSIRRRRARALVASS
jgi:hypothetical protein